MWKWEPADQLHSISRRAAESIAKRNGKELIIKAEPDDPALPAYLCKTLLTREFNPLKRVVVETVNGRLVLESPYKKALQENGFTGKYKSLVLRRQY